MEYKQLKKIFYTDKDNYESIYTGRVTGESSGHLDFNLQKFPAFYIINSEILSLTAEIIRANAKIKELFAAELPDFAREHFIRESLISEIVDTNEIEGVRSTRREVRDTLDVLEGRAKLKKNSRMRFRGIINKYLALKSGKDVSVTTAKNIREIYDEIVLEEVISENRNNMPDGELFRNSPVSIVDSRGRAVHYCSDSEKEIIRDLEKALHFYNDTDVEPLIRICLFHFLFEYIHPFYDGNGRTGRFILSEGLAKELEPICAYRISGMILANIRKYYQGFTDSEDMLNRGDLTPFLIMMLEMISKTQKEILDEQSEIAYKWNVYKEFADKICQDPKEHEVMMLLLATAIFPYETVSLKSLTDSTSVSEYKISIIIKRLEEQGYISHEIRGKKYVYKVNTEKIESEILSECP